MIFGFIQGADRNSGEGFGLPFFLVDGPARWAIVGRSWNPQSAVGDAGANAIFQSYSIEIWVPRDGGGFLRDGSEENADGGQWTTDSSGGGTLRMMAVWAETSFGMNALVEQVTRDGIDDIFEALAGGVEGDVMGHGKAIGGGGRGVSSRSIHALFEAEDGQRSLGFVATDDLLRGIHHADKATLTKKVTFTFGRLRRFACLGRFGRLGQLPSLSSAAFDAERLSIFAVHVRGHHVLDLKAQVGKAVLFINVGTMGVVDGVTAVLGVRCVEDLSGSPMAAAVFSGTHMGSEVDAVTDFLEGSRSRHSDGGVLVGACAFLDGQVPVAGLLLRQANVAGRSDAGRQHQREGT